MTEARAAPSDADRVTMFAAAYAESVRGLTQQAGVLESVRSRAGLLITAANVVTALLATPAIRDRPGIGAGGWLAIILFGLSMASAIYILLPWSKWHFAFDATKLTAKINASEWASLGPFHEELAGRNEVWWRSNAEQIERYFGAFKWGCIFLAVEVGAWMLVLAKIQVCGVAL